MGEFRNVLLIGNAGNGKSTLANVLSRSNEFEEAENRIRGTNEVKTKEFEHNGIKYRVIDTVGIGDSIKSTGEILVKLEDKANVIGEGLNQILFVTNRRFTKEEVETFNLLSQTIFDDQVTDYTTIVCTGFTEFENKEVCEKDRQTFRESIENFSMSLASATTIYVDNPPMKGRYKPISEGSRRASRKVLLEHLKPCQKVYRPELLAKFSKMIDEFNSIIEDFNEAMDDVDLQFNINVNYLEGFIPERERLIEMVEVRKEKVKEHMKNRFTVSTVSHAAVLSGKTLAIAGIWFPPALLPGFVLSASGWVGVACSETVTIVKENESYGIFEESLAKDKEKCETLGNLQSELKGSIGRFNEIRDRFKGSEYRKRNKDEKRIKVIKNVLNKILGEEEIETDVKLEKIEKTEHSFGLKTVRAALEAICKIVPSPLSFYCIYRDHKEIENRTSLDDMERAIENWRQDLKVLREKELVLNKEYEKIKWCKEKMAKLSSNDEKKKP